MQFFDLIQEAYCIHKENFNIESIEFCALCSIKTGGCPENCAYCSQSAHYQTETKRTQLLSINTVIAQAKQAKALGAKRFCMGAAWRSPPKKYFDTLLTLVYEVKQLGLETCVTAGMLTFPQAQALKASGLDYYNHNLDTSPNYYEKIITTHTFNDRLETIRHVAKAGIRVCCGGILGLGETREHRIEFLLALDALPSPPESIPINQLIPNPGTPLADEMRIDVFEFIRTVAITRIMFPRARIRLSAGRTSMSDEMQAWCLMAGANSLFIGETLLTADNPNLTHDINLLEKLNLQIPEVIGQENACV